MKLFPYGHATHPQWRMAAGLALAQLRAHMALPEYAQTPRLGLLYITDHYAWPWVFFVNLPLGVIAVLLTLSFIPPYPAPPLPAPPTPW